MKFSNFAERYTRQNPTKELMEDLGNAANSAQKVMQLGGGNPAHIGAVEALFRQQLATIASSESRFASTVAEYDGPNGNTQFINSLACYLSKTLKVDIGEENIALTNGSQSSFGILFNAFAGRFADDTNKQVLLPITPEYIGYQETSWQDTALFDYRRPAIEILDQRFFKYHIDFECLDIDPHKHGAVCVSRPTNPSGNMVADQELQKLLSECEASGIPLIIDGAYGLPFPNIVFSDATPYWNENIILCLSLSKLGLPALRTGIVVAAKPVINLITAANAGNCLAPGSLGPALVEPLLNSGELDRLCSEHIKPFYQVRLEATLLEIDRQLGHLPIKLHQPDGAMFLWMWIEGLPITSQTLYQQLKAQGLYVIAGEHFFDKRDNSKHKYECIRLNYATNEEDVKNGILILRRTLENCFELSPKTLG